MKNTLIILVILFLVLAFIQPKNYLIKKENNSSIESEKSLLDVEDFPIEIQKELENEYWLGNLGTLSLTNIQQNKFGVILTMSKGKESDNETIKKILVTDNYLIISYAIGFHEERSFIYSKITKEHFITEDFTDNIINETTIKVFRDYYDSRNPNSPRYKGHIFEVGEYNLINRRYKKIE